MFKKSLLLWILLPLIMARSPASPELDESLVASWTFDAIIDSRLFEVGSSRGDRVAGTLRITEGVSGSALRFDGYSTIVQADGSRGPELSGPFTVEAWIALQAYPWHWTAVFEQAGEEIPREEKNLPDADLSNLYPGLIGAIYGEPDLTDPQSKSPLSSFDMDWTGGAQTWSARWRGFLRAPHTGWVAFRAVVDDGLRLRVGDERVLDAWGESKERSSRIRMVEGEIYPVLLEYNNNGGAAMMKLFWSWPGHPEEIVPVTAVGYASRDDALAYREIVPPAEEEPEFRERVSLGIDAEGHPGLKVRIGGELVECISEERLPLLRWTHIAGTFDPQSGLRILVNGRLWSEKRTSGSISGVRGDIRIGSSFRRRGVVESVRKPSGDWPERMVLNGLIDEVRVHDRSLTDDEIKGQIESIQLGPVPPLDFPRMPSGPAGLPPRFEAGYLRLRYTPEWEEPWRVGELPDILVRFDDLPYRIVFWRGNNYGAAFVAENGLWMGDQSLERSGGTPYGTAEHMNDKHNRYSQARILENNTARKRIHWHYALTDISGAISRVKENGWGEWADEYYTIYPDGVSTRHQILHTDSLRHEWQETIVLNQAGDRPEDNIRIEALTLANQSGGTHTYSWDEGVPGPFELPPDANIQVTRLKSLFQPFIIFEPRPHIKPFRADVRPEWSHFPWWNHWPVAQIHNDGRRATGPDRPSHSSLSQSLEDSRLIQKREDGSYEVVTLIGMTDRPIDWLVSLARSWNEPPQLVPLGPGLEAHRFDKFQRAYVLTLAHPEPSGEIGFRLFPREDSAIVNPAFVVENWGERPVSVRVNGRESRPGEGFRYGFESHLEGTDLILWVRLEGTEVLDFSLVAVP